MSDTRRGYVPEDEREFFAENSIGRLKEAQRDLLYLMERGYPIKNASVFVGNHFLLSERQRLALVRATSIRETIVSRKKRQITGNLNGAEVSIDGFNLVISMEIALSDSTLLRCMDGTIRDLAGLRGTYRLIDKTRPAVSMIGKQLIDMGAGSAVFYLDSPVSNSGRLKQLIIEVLKELGLSCQVFLVPNADVVLQEKEFAVTSDAIILNHCSSYINLLPMILEKELPNLRYVELGELAEEDTPNNAS